MLLFLVDPASPFHPAAKSFFKRASAEGWATCPITENGFVRILGNPGFHGGPGESQKPSVTLHRRKPGGGFAIEHHLGLDAVIPLPEIDASLALADLYDRAELG